MSMVTKRTCRHGAGKEMGETKSHWVGVSLLESLKSPSLGSRARAFSPPPPQSSLTLPSRSHPITGPSPRGYLAAAEHHTCGSQRWGAARCAEGSRWGVHHLCPVLSGKHCHSGTQSRRGSCHGDTGQRRGSAQDPHIQSKN